MTRTVFISNAIPYVNARPHLGHALEFVQADAFARWHRLAGHDLFFLSGSDENSLKNVLAAEKEGITARELVDRNVTYFEELQDKLELSWDYFVRTSADPLHIRGATELWKRIEANGDVYRKSYQGLYCVGCEQFYTEAELIDGKCPEHDTVPDLVSEENWFFRLSRYAEQLREAIESDTLRITPETRKNEVLGFLRGGVEDISISRSAERSHNWGIEVPGDPSQVMYVWIDALTNYITALGFVDDSERYRKYWAEADQRIHVVGKGIIRFHAVYWPAMLMSAGVPLPTDIFVHGYITASGRKLSKSLGNAVDPVDVVDRYGAETLRYYLLADVPPFADGDFSEERLFQRRNSELANELGNLVSRVTSLIGRYREGVVPAGEDSAVETAFWEFAHQAVADTATAFERFDPREAITSLWGLVRRTNAYLDETAPWHLAKDESPEGSARLDTSLKTAAAAVRVLGVQLHPFLPATSAAMVEALGGNGDVGADWDEAVVGATVRKPPPLFERLDAPPERAE
jgi:methionyl-tRNA synthetase